MTDETTQVSEASETPEPQQASEPQQAPPPPPVSEPQQVPPPQQMAPPPPAAAATEAEIADGKIFGFLAYLLSLVGFLIVMLAKKENKFAMYHAKQGLVLFIFEVIVYFVGGLIPVLGWFVILPVGGIFVLVLKIMGIVNSLNGQEKPLPMIGQFGEKFNF